MKNINDPYFIFAVLRSPQRCRFRRGSRRNGRGQGHRNVLDVRASFGSILRKGFDRLSAVEEDSGTQQIGTVGTHT